MKYNSVLSSAVSIAVLLVLFYFVAVYFLFYESKPLKKTNTKCLDIVENKLRDRTSLKIDFNETLTCFEWDTMFVTSSSEWENYPDLKFTYIGNMHQGKESTDIIDWVDGHRNWNCIFFKKINEPIQNAFLICQTVLQLRNLRHQKFPKAKSKFKITKGDSYGRFRKLEAIKN
tara:strand:- start:479 stop:997 length:519 start_codon:yes stop_codon:yes gene_type:complete